MKLRLSWTDPTSRRPRRPLLTPPIALGQTFQSMPEEISGQSVSRMVIGDRQISDFQALVMEVEDELYLIDNGGQTYINQQQVSGQARLEHGDRIRIGQTELGLQIMDAPPSTPSQHATHLQTIAEAIEPSSSSTNGNGNGNGYHRAELNEPDQAYLSAPDIPPPSKDLDHQRNGHSRNGNGISQSKPRVTEPSPSSLNAQHRHHSNSDDQPSNNPEQLPQVTQSKGHLPKPHGNDLASGQHSQSNGFENQAPINHQHHPPAPAPQPLTPISPDTPQPLELPINTANSGCRRMVGFLFKRPCGRDNSSGCDRCANGYSPNAYSADYELYEGFGRFEPGDWGYGLLENPKER